MFNGNQKLLTEKINLLYTLEARVQNLLKELELSEKNILWKEQLLHNKEVEFEKKRLIECELYFAEYLKKSEEGIVKKTEAINAFVNEQTATFPWIAKAIADYFEIIDDNTIKYLKNKQQPALNAAESISKIKLENKVLREKLRSTENIINFYEFLNPDLNNYLEDDLNGVLNEIETSKKDEDFENDPVLNFIDVKDYETLTTAERNQKALNKYLNSNQKTKFQIGKDYERYIGYLFEIKGYDVEYHGINKGINDLGVDLILRKKSELIFVQCKYWRKDKIIHENHINQLYGTSIKHYLELNDEFVGKNQRTLFPDLILSKKIRAYFVTTAKLSETAQKFADILGIEILNPKYEKYPIIKCNISKMGEKIYHLPFDLQYDNTNVLANGGKYVETVLEAEQLGFRRAYKWSGN